MIKSTAWNAALVVALVLPCPAGAAEGLPDFRGRTVTIIASFEAGGPYDFYGRLIAGHIGAYLPGHPTVVVQNMPGAGGLRGANYLYNIAARDGTVMGVVSQTVAVGQVLATTAGIQYDARKFTWIGRINSNVEVLHTWSASGVTSIEDAKKREVILAGTGPTSSSVVMPRVMNELIGTKFKVVTGFQGPTSAQLALERGEVEGIVKPWSAIKTSTPDWLHDKKISLIVQYTRERHRELSDVPAIVDLGRDASQRQIFALFAGGAALGTAIVAPPTLAPPVVSILRKAFDETMADPALLDEVRRSGVDIDPLPGAALQKVVAGTFVIDPEVLERARKLSLGP
ncbi:MAG TPA: tripartite tricarboxylate transporter substrate-binding protein [Xanthobacteraceae bacterium]|jgi:tripartite-type tricarboxylate transporter receptor subunit TctC